MFRVATIPHHVKAEVAILARVGYAGCRWSNPGAAGSMSGITYVTTSSQCTKACCKHCWQASSECCAYNHHTSRVAETVDVLLGAMASLGCVAGGYAAYGWQSGARHEHTTAACGTRYNNLQWGIVLLQAQFINERSCLCLHSCTPRQ